MGVYTITMQNIHKYQLFNIACTTIDLGYEASSALPVAIAGEKGSEQLEMSAHMSGYYSNVIE